MKNESVDESRGPHLVKKLKLCFAAFSYLILIIIVFAAFCFTVFSLVDFFSGRGNIFLSAVIFIGVVAAIMTAICLPLIFLYNQVNERFCIKAWVLSYFAEDLYLSLIESQFYKRRKYRKHQKERKRLEAERSLQRVREKRENPPPENYPVPVSLFNTPNFVVLESEGDYSDAES